ncbi:MAG: AAA family ATPase [Eubacteriales bacterium]
MPDYTVTIARGFGSGGRTIGKILAQRLDVNYYDRDLIRLASEESGINIELFGKADEKVRAGLFRKYNRSYGERIISPESTEFVSDDNLFNYQAKIIRDLSASQNCIIIGRCADYILRDVPHVLRLFICADKDTCVRNVVELYGLVPDNAEHEIEKIDRARAAYYKYYTGREWNDPTNYDLCINTTKTGFDGAADIIVDFINHRRSRGE